MKASPLPTQERLKELLRYEPATGKFYWRKTLGSRKAGSPAGTLTNRGYIHITVNGCKYVAHRLAWMYTYGEDPIDLVVDHVNHNKTDNSINNLQLLSHQANVQKQVTQHSCSSKYRGVDWYKASGKWRAQIRVNGKRQHLGYYEREYDAAMVVYLYAHFVFKDHNFNHPVPNYD